MWRTGCHITGGWAAVISALNLGAGQTIGLTILGPRRLLITTESEPQFSATVADAARAAAERSARAAARAQLPPATESELEVDVSRVSALKVGGVEPSPCPTA